MPEAVVLLYTIHDVLKLERELKQRGLKVKPVPTPRHLSSDCGTALRFRRSDTEAVRATAADMRLDLQGIHEL